MLFLRFENALIWKGDTEKEKIRKPREKAGRDVKISLPFYVEK